MNKIGILLIATNQYKGFIEQLLESMDKYFFVGEKINVYLFIDDTSFKFKIPSRIKIKYFKIASLKFPAATLMRYLLFSQVKKHIDSDFIFYGDVDIKFVAPVGEEILPLDLPEENQLVAVRHCGFYGKGGGSWETRQISTAYIAPEKRKFYYAGGWQGGRTSTYLSACETMRDNIETDRKSGVMSTWHDEGHLNRYLSERMGKFKELTPDYCLVEEIEKRVAWSVNMFSPKIIALKKNHNEIRK